MIIIASFITCALLSVAFTKPGNELVTEPLETSTATESPREAAYRKYVGEQEYHVPFKTRISESFKEGQTIHAAGKIAKEPKRIVFNFHKGGNEEDDMPLHLSVRFDEGIFSGRIVYNTFKNGNWSTDEQRISSPYKAGEDFDIRVRIRGGKYYVYGNRRELGVFEMRQPLEGVNHVSIIGCLENLRVFHYGGTIFPNPYSAVAKLAPGKRLDISALPTGNRVNINLYRSSGEYALQISIRYNEGAVVRNAMNNNVWGKEEREGGFPLSQGEIFDLTIVNEPYSYQIFINGKRFCTFAHRSSASDLETLEIDGSVDVQTVTINDALAG